MDCRSVRRDGAVVLLLLSVLSADASHSHAFHYIHRRFVTGHSPLKLNERVAQIDSKKERRRKKEKADHPFQERHHRPTWNLAMIS